MIATPIASAIGPLLGHSLDLQTQYERKTSLNDRKMKGQFFSPAEVCHFMASLFSLKQSTTFRLLDPGAGLGSLAAALCDSFLHLRSSRHLEIHLFENDPEVLPFLHKSMQHCGETLSQRGHSMHYEIHAKDFILDTAATVFAAPSLFRDSYELGEFDGVIMHRPPFKVNTASP